MVNFRSLSVGLKSKRKSLEYEQQVKNFQDEERKILDGIDKWLQCQILPSYTTAISRAKGLPPMPSEVEECERLIHVLGEGILDMEILALRAQDQMRRELLLSQATVMVQVLIEHLETLSRGSEEDVVQALKEKGVELPDDNSGNLSERTQNSAVQKDHNKRDLILAAAANKAEHQLFALDSESDSENDGESEADSQATTPPSSLATKVPGVPHSSEAEGTSAAAERAAERKSILAQTNALLAEFKMQRTKNKEIKQLEDSSAVTPESSIVDMAESSSKGEEISE